MAGLTAIGGVGAGVTQTRYQATLGARRVPQEPAVPQDLGAAALRLIRVALHTGESVGQDLDVRG
jgi:hypothetical protein